MVLFGFQRVIHQLSHYEIAAKRSARDGCLRSRLLKFRHT